MQDREERYRTMIEVSPQSIWSARADGYITYCNQWWMDYTGLTMAQSEGTGWTQAIHPDHRQRVLDVWLEAAAKGSNYEVEVPLRRASDGMCRWHLARGLPIKDKASRVIQWMGVAVDIHDRKQAEEAVKQAETQLRLITDAIPALISYIDRDARYRLTNRTYETWFGRTRAEFSGKHLSEVLGESAWNLIRPHVEAALAGDHVSYQALVPYKDGGERWIDVSYVPDVDEQGEIHGYVALVNDITNRKLAEDAVRENERRLRLVIDSMPQKIFTATPNGDVDYFNPQWTEFTGLTFEQIKNWGWTQFIHPDDVEENVRRWRHAVDTGELFLFEHRFRHANGDYRWHISRASPMRDAAGNIIMWIGSNTDIDDQKRAEKTLRDGEERVRLVLDSALDAVVRMSKDGVITGWNPQAETVLGWRREEAMNRMLGGLIVPEQYREAHRNGLDHFLKTGQGPVLNKRLELTALRKDGKIFPIELTIAPLRLDDGFEFSAFIRDITERKRLEDALIKANEQLERGVEQRTAQLAQKTAELQRVNEALERSNLDLKQFAYIASHDLQTPLRSISGFVQALQTEYESKLSEQADGWIQRTVQSTQRMQTLINDLLVYSRVDARARPFELISLREVFDDAISLLDASVRESGAQVTCGELPRVMGDRSQLVQLLRNLIGNAIKFHSGKPPRIELRAKHGAEEWVFSVRDNGIGVDPKFYERIFEIFQRLHNPQEYPGTGIGLAVCRRVVHHHGGRIWVESELGRGSIFYFTIPERI